MEIVQRASQFSKGVTGKVNAPIRSALRRAPLSISEAKKQPETSRISEKMGKRIPTALS